MSQAGRRKAADDLSQLNPAEARNTDSSLRRQVLETEHDYLCTGPAPGSLWFGWIHGSPVAAKNQDPRIQVMTYNEDTYVLRQNICVDWRGPFTYLLFGNKAALLIDSGGTADAASYPLRSTVDALITRWESIRGKRNLPLTVALTSVENRDQNVGLAQFADRPHSRLVPASPGSAKAFYGFSDESPESAGKIDLGGRVLDVLATPGTHRDGVTFYDPYTKHLFTGDLLMPGRIAIANERDYLGSLQRLQRWKSEHHVKWVLGGRVDMQFIPGRAYGRFATFKPFERELQMPPEQIDQALAAAQEIRGQKTVLARPHFWLMNGVGPDERPETTPDELPKWDLPRPV